MDKNKKIILKAWLLNIPMVIYYSYLTYIYFYVSHLYIELKVNSVFHLIVIPVVAALGFYSVHLSDHIKK